MMSRGATPQQKRTRKCSRQKSIDSGSPCNRLSSTAPFGIEQPNLNTHSALQITPSPNQCGCQGIIQQLKHEHTEKVSTLIDEISTLRQTLQNTIILNIQVSFCPISHIKFWIVARPGSNLLPRRAIEPNQGS